MAEKKSKDLAYRSDYNKIEGSNPQARSVSFQKVTYGGINGPYYSATTTRRTGSDGVNYLPSLSFGWVNLLFVSFLPNACCWDQAVLEECKQADRTTGQAEHRISRGMLDKVLSLCFWLFSNIGRGCRAIHREYEDYMRGTFRNLFCRRPDLVDNICSLVILVSFCYFSVFLDRYAPATLNRHVMDLFIFERTCVWYIPKSSIANILQVSRIWQRCFTNLEKFLKYRF